MHKYVGTHQKSSLHSSMVIDDKTSREVDGFFVVNPFLEWDIGGVYAVMKLPFDDLDMAKVLLADCSITELSQ